MWLILNSRGIVVACLMSFALVGCVPRINSFRHEPSMAATQAENFAKKAFVLRDPERAYRLTSEEFRTYSPPEQFRDLVSKMHPSNYPLSLEATEFEPIPGQKAMYIFLSGQNGRQNGSEIFYYRLLMEGVKETNYQVSGLWRGSGPFPPSSIRKHLK